MGEESVTSQARSGFREGAAHRAELLLGSCGVSPLGWGVSETAPLLRWLEPGKGTDLPRTKR